MKLFKFFPNEFCRCYLVADSIDDVIGRKEQLFREYLKDDNPWTDPDDPDEFFYIEDKRKDFYEGLEKSQRDP